MKEIKYIPEPCDGSIFKGHVVIKKASMDDVLECNEIVEKLKDSPTSQGRSMVEWSKKFYVSVDIKSIDGTEYKSFDDLKADAECVEVLFDIAAALSQGVNKKKLMAQTPKVGQKL